MMTVPCCSRSGFAHTGAGASLHACWWYQAKLKQIRNHRHCLMGYHHEHDWLQDLNEPLYDPELKRRAERQELKPLEVRRMIWEGATLVQRKDVFSDSLQGAIQLDPDMDERLVHELLPDMAQPLLCVGLGSGAAFQEPAVLLAEQLLNLGYQHVFCLAPGMRHGVAAGG